MKNAYIAHSSKSFNVDNVKSSRGNPAYWLEEEVEFFNEDTKMKVVLEPRASPTDYSAVVVSYLLNGKEMIVTGRDVDEYLPHLLEDYHAFEGAKQFIEVGPGCAEFIPKMIQSMGSVLQKKPIVIDPVDYEAARDHLQSVLDQFPDHPVVQKMQGRIREFIARCTILLGNDVIHIREKLGDALQTHPDLLIGKADFVLSMHGPITHCDSEFPSIPIERLTSNLSERKIIRAMHNELLKKPNGRLLTNL